MTNHYYNVKTVEMIMASSIIATNLSNNLEELSMVRTNWTAEYVTQLTNQIDTIVEKYLGLDKTKPLRNATQVVLEIQAIALKEVAFLKKQIEVDFPNTKAQILKELGFNLNYRKVQQSDQEALIQLLYAIKQGMTDELKTQIVAKGTNPALIEKIISHANQLKEADLTQETLKKSSASLSAEATNALNNLYNEIIGICKIASSYYNNNPMKKAMFTFSKIIASMNAN